MRKNVVVQNFGDPSPYGHDTMLIEQMHEDIFGISAMCSICNNFAIPYRQFLSSDSDIRKTVCCVLLETQCKEGRDWPVMSNCCQKVSFVCPFDQQHVKVWSQIVSKSSYREHKFFSPKR